MPPFTPTMAFTRAGRNSRTRPSMGRSGGDEARYGCVLSYLDKETAVGKSFLLLKFIMVVFTERRKVKAGNLYYT